MRRFGVTAVFIALACATLCGCAAFDNIDWDGSKRREQRRAENDARMDAALKKAIASRSDPFELGKVATMTDSELTAAKAHFLCWAYHKTKDDEAARSRVKREIQQRELGIEPWEWKHIDAGEVAIGMSLWGSICSWGVGSVATTTTAYGTSRVVSFRRYGFGSWHRAVYLRDGKVTAKQRW